MCMSEAEGGQCCAAHTRPRYEQTPVTSPDWFDAARDYASTPQGRTQLTAEAAEAGLFGDRARVARLRAALMRGETLRAVNAETVRLRDTHRRRSLIQEEIDGVRNEFGVATEQVLRDHAISHILGALAGMRRADRLIFFGGTALSRSFLPQLRLSEDLDLLAVGPRAELARDIERSVARRLARSHGAVNWTPSLVDTKGSDAAVLGVAERIQIRVQLLHADDYPAWPTEPHRLVQRYADAPDASLRTLTASAFVASKTSAWLDRCTPRDLYDLWALGEHGHITPDAGALFKRLGPTHTTVQPWMFRTAPTEAEWQDALGHQGVVRVTAAEALAEVQDMWARAAG
jgi:predicted nucleotidyltransferase component of viral defense system